MIVQPDETRGLTSSGVDTPPASATDIPAESVRAELDRILSSAAFSSAENQSRFLRFVVEQTLGGNAYQLKEYLVGVEVFGRGESFDPRLDSIVRVEARRLRERLAKYYRTPGLSDPVIIQFRKGSYVPLFRQATVAERVTPQKVTRARLSLRWSIVVGLVLAAAAGKFLVPKRPPPGNLLRLQYCLSLT